MPVGLAVAKANAELNVYRGTSLTAVSVFVRLHVGDPGAAGTANGSANTTRNAITFAVPANGVMDLATLAAFAMTTAETISHVSLWDAATAGNFLESAALTSPVPVINGSQLTFSQFRLSRAPIAA